MVHLKIFKKFLYRILVNCVYSLGNAPLGYYVYAFSASWLETDFSRTLCSALGCRGFSSHCLHADRERLGRCG